MDRIVTGLACPEEEGENAIRSRSSGLGYRRGSNNASKEQEGAAEKSGNGAAEKQQPEPGLIRRRQHQFKSDYCGHLYMWACVLVMASASVNKQIKNGKELDSDGEDADDGDGYGAEGAEGAEVSGGCADEMTTICRAAYKAGFNHPHIFAKYGSAVDFSPTYGVNPVADFGFGPAAVKWHSSCTRAPKDHPAIACDGSHAIGTLSERIPEWKAFQADRLHELHNIFAFVLPDTGPR